MANEQAQPTGNQYAMAREVTKQKQNESYPASDASSVKPDYLISHQNHFDKNTYTPEQSYQKAKSKPLTKS